MSNYISISIWALLILAVFAIAWRKGYLLQIATYVQQTREELRKCTWPTWEELKGSTVLVSISIVLLGVFTYVLDRAFGQVVLWMFKA
jgi:preprotein translocase subunit SecE